MTPGSALLGALEEGGVGTAMRDSLWLFPLVETVHIIGFSILVGSIVAFDLRILGVSRRLSVRLLARHLLPWSLAALLLIVPTGVMMFASEATDLVDNVAFVVKMVLLMLAATNAAAFHLGVFRNAALWDQNAPSPTGAKLHAVASLLIWVSVITCGRMIAYL
jgi:uncharacterized protein DUF6644